MRPLIKRTRGDNYPITAIIKINGTAVDLNDGSVLTFSFKNDTTPVVSITGVITGTLGEVTFTPTTEFDTAGVYIFDIQREVGGVKATHSKGDFILEEDVTV